MTGSASQMEMATSSSLFYARQESPLLAAIGWIESALTGTIATIVAILAVAAVGLFLLQGRLAVRDGLRVLIGCFILFGAGSIAAGIRSLGEAGTDGAAVERAAVQNLQPPEPLQIPEDSADFDPYAGASVQ